MEQPLVSKYNMKTNFVLLYGTFVLFVLFVFLVFKGLINKLLWATLVSLDLQITDKLTRLFLEMHFVKTFLQIFTQITNFNVVALFGDEYATVIATKPTVITYATITVTKLIVLKYVTLTKTINVHYFSEKKVFPNFFSKNLLLYKAIRNYVFFLFY